MIMSTGIDTAAEPQLTAEDLGRVHLIGVGGIGMSGLARLLLTRGIPVSGSELKEWPALAGLRALGGRIFMRHEPSNLDGVDTVVYSSAIPADHLELVEARARGLRIMHRSEALAAAMSNAHHGSGEPFVAEADESDRSFLHYRPHIAVITNIDADHLNVHGDLAGLTESFVEFGSLVGPDGFVVTCADDPGARRLAE